MATKNRQSQFCRSLSLILFVSVIAGIPAFAGDINPSNYSIFGGDRFFLLSESAFNSDEEAVVRLEAPGRREALEAYSGADIRIYRVSDPLGFLKNQKNLHRPEIKGAYLGEGLSNVLNYLWDSWYKKSRLAWQRIFSYSARNEAVKSNADLKQVPPFTYHTRFQNNPQFKRLSGLALVDEFRYPLWSADPVKPPTGVALAGSSSNFIGPRNGNVYIPLGRQKPGLYLVEALLGSFRATALVFVSDSVAVTKISGNQLLVWAVNKKSGVPAAGAKLLLTDGLGTLAKGVTGKDGIFMLKDKRLEKSYVLGLDTSGGVFVSENFYYDSEIYNAKLYVFTDRPLYQPGDTVFFKLLGREFQNSSRSTALVKAAARVMVVDPAGTPLLSKTLDIAPGADGGQSSFRLPDSASPGGYSIQILFKQTTYNSSFRVARYVKPHFELDISLDKKEYRTNERIKVRVKATYPNGEPVRKANVEIDIRKQKMAMVEGEVQYLDRFPVRISRENHTSDGSGAVDLELPEVADPTRYVLSARAVDGSSYRVTATREILVQSSSGVLGVKSEKNFSAPGEKVSFRMENPEGAAPEGALDAEKWEVIRLQDQSRTSGPLNSGRKDFEISFEKPGSYTVGVLDREGNLLGSASHWVQGPELAGVPGSISILLDKDQYEPGQSARVLITFSEEVREALLTLERDRVEQQTLLTRSAAWIKCEKISDREWRAAIPISEKFSPNIMLSVAYVRGGKYFFENKGIIVSVPKIKLQFKADKKEYAPGETATVDVYASLSGRPVKASLTVSVVDEMVYVLQPEISPDISDFFYHLRRNQVRTTSSLNFHSFDAAVSFAGVAPSSSGQDAERSLKLRERPRREDKDTALWMPKLRTDELGRARFSFVMPDSVTRWRITGRAMSDAGIVGQRKDYLVSSKEIYLKWTGPTAFRKKDYALARVIAFNLGASDRNVTFKASGMGASVDRSLVLKPGPNYLAVPVKTSVTGTVSLQICQDSKVLDELSANITALPEGWVGTQSVAVRGQPAGAVAKIPPGAFNVRLEAAPDTARAFLRAVDYLVDYPYGCVEQTASRLIPLSMAYSLLNRGGLSVAVREQLQTRIINERLRLAKLAGPEAAFSWWGNHTSQSAFMTAYAYFADWSATSALDLKLPASHWEHVLEVYSKSSQEESLFRTAITLWLISEMELPTRTLLEGVLQRAAQLKPTPAASGKVFQRDDSLVLSGNGIYLQQRMTLILLSIVAKKNDMPVPALVADMLPEARTTLAQSEIPLAKSLSLLDKRSASGLPPDTGEVRSVLDSIKSGDPTIDRALSLAFLRTLMGLTVISGQPDMVLEKNWDKAETRLGRASWRYTGKHSGTIKIPGAVFQRGEQSAQILYDFYGKETGLLPVKIERRLYKLEQREKALEFSAVPVDEDWKVNTNDIYVDEIKLAPNPGAVFQFGLAEAALPPGAAVELTTWGMTVKDSKGEEMRIGAPGFQAGDGSYSAGIEKLDGAVVLRHLIRFSQVGDFKVPPVRFFRMYEPTEKAFEGGLQSAFRTITVR